MVLPEPKLKVAVIGAGPIGLFLAWRLGQVGHRVKVFEQKASIEEIKIKACSSLISERLKNFVPLDSSLIENTIDFCFLHFPKKTIALRLRPVHFVVNRPGLIQTLFGLAQSTGAEIVFGRQIKEIPTGFDKVIGCDGAFSRLREALALPQPSMRLGLQIFQEKKDCSNYVETWPFPRHFSAAKSGGGFCWKIPRGKQTEYGALGPSQTVKDAFQKFLQKQGLSYPPPLFRDEKRWGALVPSGLCLPKQGNITLCGDAAGLTKPWSGGGIIWGLSAAEILLKHFPNFSNYHKEVRQVFGKTFFRAKIATSLVYFFGFHLPFLFPSKICIDNDPLTPAP